jgi:hypothetical protein
MVLGGLDSFNSSLNEGVEMTAHGKKALLADLAKARALIDQIETMVQAEQTKGRK